MFDWLLNVLADCNVLTDFIVLWFKMFWLISMGWLGYMVTQLGIELAEVGGDGEVLPTETTRVTNFCLKEFLIRLFGIILGYFYI